MSWASSNRRAELPPNWEELRRATFAAQATALQPKGQCLWFVRGKRCPRQATECDHIGDKFDHGKLQGLCADHHRQKTLKQAFEAKAAIRAKAKRPPERHPGERTKP